MGLPHVSGCTVVPVCEAARGGYRTYRVVPVCEAARGGYRAYWVVPVCGQKAGTTAGKNAGRGEKLSKPLSPVTRPPRVHGPHTLVHQWPTLVHLRVVHLGLVHLSGPTVGPLGFGPLKWTNFWRYYGLRGLGVFLERFSPTPSPAGLVHFSLGFG